MRLATSAGALMTMMALLSGLPATLHAQNGGWAVPAGEQDFLQNRYPELKGLTRSEEDQKKARDLCLKYRDDNQIISMAVVRCNAAARFYMSEGQKEADAQRQQESSPTSDAVSDAEFDRTTCLADMTKASEHGDTNAAADVDGDIAGCSAIFSADKANHPLPKDVADTCGEIVYDANIDKGVIVPPLCKAELKNHPEWSSATAQAQLSNASASSTTMAASSSEAQPNEASATDLPTQAQEQDHKGLAAPVKEQEAAQLQAQATVSAVDKQQQDQQAAAAEKQQQIQQEQSAAQEKQKEEHDEKTALYWKVGILGFLVSNVILFVGAAKKKFVVFYDKWDIIHAVLIFVSPACGYFMAWLIDVGTSGESFLHPICIGLGWVLAAWFSVVTLISSIRHNKNVTIGIFVGLMKIYTVILIASIALLSFTMLNSSMGSMPKDMDTLEKMQRVKQDKENGAMWAVVAAGLLYLLVNGAEVYEERGWNLPS